MGCSASRPNTNIITRTHTSTEDPHSFSSLESSMVSSHTSSSSPPPPPPLVSRALSLPTPLVHHPPLRKGDTHHLVSLTSTTYGSLSLIDIQNPATDTTQGDDSPVHEGQDESLSPDSVINTWELMDGLDDCCDFDLGKPKSLFNIRPKELPSLTKPLWKHLSEESLLSKLDPNVVSSYRRALSSRQLVNESKSTTSICSSSSPSCTSSLSDSWVKVPSSTESKIVLYFTSLRGIRKTYEDCCCVKMIFRGFRVAVDERDISMDSMYRNELQTLLGGKLICLPQVFVSGKHIGGVEEIKQLNESGELSKILQGFPVRDPGVVCDGCGDARFVPCPNCKGSRKVFEEDEARLRRCPDCNENGLIRCPACCSS